MLDRQERICHKYEHSDGRLRCDECFWCEACKVRADHDGKPIYCDDFMYSPKIEPMKKPNFWIYLAGGLALCAACVLFGWLGLKYDNAGAFFIVGAFSVMASDVMYEYQQRLRDYWRYLREVQHND